MVIATVEECTVSGEPVPGWEYRCVHALNKRLTWLQIACEMIDNVSASARGGCPASVSLRWITSPKKSRKFTVADDGVGCDDPEAFTRPGKSIGILSDRGASTFGTGLYACEARITGDMTIITRTINGRAYRLSRSAKVSRDGEMTPLDDDDGRLDALPHDTGTSITFTNFQMSPIKESLFVEMASELGRTYGGLLAAGDLKITIERNGSKMEVKAVPPPDLISRYRKRITAKGHSYDIEWGVTRTRNGDRGARLVYGGKQFGTTSKPCGEGGLSRFYAQITIPRTRGAEVMDLLKRFVDDEAIETVYDRCFALFEPQLKEADERAGKKEKRDLSEKLRNMLKLPQSGGLVEGDGVGFRRKFKGRDPNGKGIEPVGSGQTRNGRRGSKSPRKMVIEFEPMAWSFMCKYDIGANRLWYNLSRERIAEWYKDDNTQSLALTGAAHVAKELENADDDVNYEDVFQQMVENIYAAL